MTECYSCGSEYKKIGIHWGLSDCNYPPVTDEQKDIFNGLLLGDGCVVENTKNDYMSVRMITHPFLRWLDDKMEYISNGVKLKSTAEEVTEGWNGYSDEKVNMEKRKDHYIWNSISHPHLTEERNRWYGSGEKVFPDIDFNSSIAKVWYVCDGGLGWGGDLKTPQLYFYNISQNKQREIMCSWFEDYGFNPHPTDRGLIFPTSESMDILDWLGEPLAGFEYKWVSSTKEEYMEVKNEKRKNL